MDNITPYDQDDQLNALGSMDTSLTDLVPDFIPQLSQPQPSLLQDSVLVFLPPQKTDLASPPIDSLQSSLSPMSAFMSPMDTTDAAAAAAFDQYMMPAASVDPLVDISSDLRNLSASPPQLIPSPGAVHGGTPFAATTIPGPEAAMEPAGAVTTTRSRANTSLSPPAFGSLSPPSGSPGSAEFLPGQLSTAATPNVEEAISQKQPQTVIGKLLKDIALTAIDAGDAFENHQAVEQTHKVGELRDRIVHVLDMIATLSFKDRDAVNGLPVIQPAGLADPMSVHLPTPSTSAMDHNHLVVSDQSRKRCASDLEEHRTVKALKREPLDDSPLLLGITDTQVLPGTTFTVPPGAPLTYAVGPAAMSGSQSRPSSRPPTPSTSLYPNPFNTPLASANPLGAGFGYPQPSLAATGGLSGAPLPMSAGSMNTGFPAMHAPWPDPVIPTSRHHHSLSAGSIPGSLLGLAGSPTTVIPNPIDTFVQQQSLPPASQSPLASLSMPPPAAAAGPNVHLVRSTRSGSINGTGFHKGPYSHSHSHVDLYSEWRNAKGSAPTRANGQSSWYMGPDSSRSFLKQSQSVPQSTHNTPPSDDDDEDEDEESDDDQKAVPKSATADRPAPSPPIVDLAPEYRKDVDRIFFEFLNKLCSNLDATDSKGEQIHQTLMAKKMQRLDESPDFRPFKFRIQAFTLAFLEELSRQGYPEEKIPMKKVRNYLWRQQYILRFNEDGKKAKSKGNHIWNIEAKKAGDGQWEFRPFYRKLAGNPPSVAYCGLRWSWKPHVWDPQYSFKKIPVTYSSPSLPPWLTWKDGELSGTPPPDAESCSVTAVATFTVDGQETQLTHTFTISIAPVSALDSTPYPRSRRSSLIGEHPPKRSTSDSALFQAPQRMNARPTRADDTRVIRVLQNVAQRVTTEAESQFVSGGTTSSSQPIAKQGESFHDLVKQKHVLEQTVEAYDKAISGQGHYESRRLAVAAQHVVLSAAQAVIADRTVATGGVPTPQTDKVAIQSVSVSELTDTTQDAIAMAIKMNGTASTEMDIIVTATSILKSRTPMGDASTPPATTAVTPPGLANRPPAAAIAPPSRISSGFPVSNLSTLPEY